MDLSKSYEFFRPELCTAPVHIVGCGSVGSTLAENLARNGIRRFCLWDFDKVEPHNLANQLFDERHIGMLKTEALASILKDINSEVEIKLMSNGWDGQMMSGFIFLAVDRMEIRQAIVKKHMYSDMVKAMFDFRTLLTGAQHYAADWQVFESKEKFMESMNFTTEEAKESTPVSACGTTLGVATTVRLISLIGCNNLVRFLKGEGLWEMVIADGFAPAINVI